MSCDDRVISTQILRPFQQTMKENGILRLSDVPNKDELKQALGIDSEDRMNEIWDILRPMDADIQIAQESKEAEEQYHVLQQKMQEFLHQIEAMQIKMSSMKIISRNQKEAHQIQSKIRDNYLSFLQLHQKRLENLISYESKENINIPIDEQKDSNSTKNNINTLNNINNGTPPPFDPSEIKFREWLVNVVQKGQYLPLFQSRDLAQIRCIKQLDDVQLKSIGIVNTADRARILSKSHQFKSSHEEFKGIIHQNALLFDFVI